MPSATLPRNVEVACSWPAALWYRFADDGRSADDVTALEGLRDLGYVNLAIDGGWTRFNRGGLNSSGYPVQPAGWAF